MALRGGGLTAEVDLCGEFEVGVALCNLSEIEGIARERLTCLKAPQPMKKSPRALGEGKGVLVVVEEELLVACGCLLLDLGGVACRLLFALADRLKGASVTVWIFGEADGGADIHQRLVVVKGVGVVYHAVGDLPQLFGGRGGEGVNTAEYPFDIGLHDRNGFLEGEDSDGVSGVFANTRELDKGIDILWKLGDLGCGLVEISRTGVVA